jgi:hypothetical protein
LLRVKSRKKDFPDATPSTSREAAPMSVIAAFRLISAFVLALVCLLPGPGWASDLARYKDLRNEYLKVTDVKERERIEERYVDTGGKVTLQKIPYKEVMVTAELTQKPPSNMETMFSDAASNPFFKVCMARFDADGKTLDEDCQSLRFQSLVKGNIGTASFRVTEDTARYAFRVAQKQGDKGTSIKLWTPLGQ